MVASVEATEVRRTDCDCTELRRACSPEAEADATCADRGRVRRGRDRARGGERGCKGAGKEACVCACSPEAAALADASWAKKAAGRGKERRMGGLVALENRGLKP